MSHCFYEGHVAHTRFSPKRHAFSYPFFLLDIDVQQLSTLKNRLFSFGRMNLFSFFARDHFGESDSFEQNIKTLLASFHVTPTASMRFVTLPRIMNFVFNPISILLLHEEGSVTALFAEVHNYNGGREVYYVPLEKSSANGCYSGEAQKSMYVSPFMPTEGLYRFELCQHNAHFSIRIIYSVADEKMLVASFSGDAKAFSATAIAKLFMRHTLLSVKVVTRTLWQSLRLRLKGLVFMPPRTEDMIRRF